MKPIPLASAREFIDFGASSANFQPGFAESQLEGAVAAHNMLVRNRVAYLADEVGLGKTYVALGVMALLRAQQPGARVLVIAPRENIQRKWIKEQSNFVLRNWRHRDGRVKALDDRPARRSVFCGSLREFVHELVLDDHRDFFLRMTSFSLRIQESDARKTLRKQLRRDLPWIRQGHMPTRDAQGFLEGLGRTLNRVLPDIDLLVVDEAHNLKHGWSPTRKGAVRNHLMAALFGHPQLKGEEWPEYRPRVKNLLLLSATPFESDYGALERQVSLFGLGGLELRQPDGSDPRPLARLRQEGHELGARRELVRRMMLRRISHLNVAGERWTKNMYRREWRQGGYREHDDPIELSDPRTRLIVGLMQKKVSEVLQDERFNNHFQMGMLSSFESFLETVGRRRRRKAEEDEPTFEGEQIADDVERKGIDTDALEDVVRSHREKFGHGLPHPKLDATAAALSDAFETGEKALVFVRRVATVRELGDKLNDHADRWLRQRMEEGLPDLHPEIADLFERYEAERGGRVEGSDPGESPEIPPEEVMGVDPDDEGGKESFFAWFFRGKGPEGVLSGGAFQKNRLGSISSALATLFEDDWVAWLLGRPDDVLAALAQAVGQEPAALRRQLRASAWAWFQGRTQRTSGYPRLYVFEAYQVAALRMLAASDGELGERAAHVLRTRFPAPGTVEGEVPEGFPEPEVSLGATTVFTELARRPRLREALWPEEGSEDFARRFRRREERRELLSAMARLGAPFIDLYLIAIEAVGSFALGQSDQALDAGELARRWLDRLEEQAQRPGFNGHRELAEAAAAFDSILAVNFHEAHHMELWELPRLFGATLQRQVPVGSMSGQVSHRVVRQFRMPGFPLVLACTDVLQEGEDLHLFCRRVIHYGISWTPSAMEQRTGRIDRIGSLVQRELEGREQSPAEETKIQVHYPHLLDTVEVLQVRRLLKQMTRFLLLIHDFGRGEERSESRVDVDREILEAGLVEALTEPLRSAFPVESDWLREDAPAWEVRALPEAEYKEHLGQLWEELRENWKIEVLDGGGHWGREGILFLNVRGEALAAGRSSEGSRLQHFRVTLHPGRDGSSVYLRCQSHIGELDLTDHEVVDELYVLQREMGLVKLASTPVGTERRSLMSVERSMLFGRETTQYGEFEQLVRRVVASADRFEREMLGLDEDPETVAKWGRDG